MNISEIKTGDTIIASSGNEWTVNEVHKNRPLHVVANGTGIDGAHWCEAVFYAEALRSFRSPKHVAANKAAYEGG